MKAHDTLDSTTLALRNAVDSAQVEYDQLVVSSTATAAQLAAAKAEIARLQAIIDAGGPVDPPPVDPPVDPPVTGGLKWGLPTGWENFRLYEVPSSGATLTIPSGVDALIVPKAADNIVAGTVTVQGGRQRVLYNMIREGLAAKPTDTSYDTKARGVRFYDGDDAGHDWVLGLLGLEGTWFSDTIQVAHRSNNNRDCTIQAVRNNGTNYGLKNGVHADFLQCWGGARILRASQVVATDCEYQGAYLDCADGRGTPTGTNPGWEFDRMELIGSVAPGGTNYGITDREPGYTKLKCNEVYVSGFGRSGKGETYSNAPASVQTTRAPKDFAPRSWWNAAGDFIGPKSV